MALYRTTQTMIRATERLERRIEKIFDAFSVASHKREKIWSVVRPLRNSNRFTNEHYQHSLRVTIWLYKIAKFIEFDQSTVLGLLFAGITHDSGKIIVPTDVLGKQTGWTKRDASIMRRHVRESYRILKTAQFDFTAQVAVLHHRYQRESYPRVLPACDVPFSKQTDMLIQQGARMLALADCWDALSRRNDRYQKSLTPRQKQKEMIRLNPDQKDLLKRLFKNKVLS